MQKLVTINVDTKQLIRTAGNAFSLNEVDSINELLELGWEIWYLNKRHSSQDFYNQHFCWDL